METLYEVHPGMPRPVFIETLLKLATQNKRWATILVRVIGSQSQHVHWVGSIDTREGWVSENNRTTRTIHIGVQQHPNYFLPAILIPELRENYTGQKLYVLMHELVHSLVFTFGGTDDAQKLRGLFLTTRQNSKNCGFSALPGLYPGTYASPEISAEEDMVDLLTVYSFSPELFELFLSHIFLDTESLLPVHRNFGRQLREYGLRPTQFLTMVQAAWEFLMTDNSRLHTD